MKMAAKGAYHHKLEVSRNENLGEETRTEKKERKDELIRSFPEI